MRLSKDAQPPCQITSALYHCPHGKAETTRSEPKEPIPGHVDREPARMNCFEHSDQDAVGVCSKCGKACCASCVGEDAPKLVCSRCLGLVEGDEVTTVRSPLSRLIGADAVEEHQDKLRVALFALLAFSIIVLPFFDHTNRQISDPSFVSLYGRWQWSHGGVATRFACFYSHDPWFGRFLALTPLLLAGWIAGPLLRLFAGNTKQAVGNRRFRVRVGLLASYFCMLLAAPMFGQFTTPAIGYYAILILTFTGLTFEISSFWINRTPAARP